RIGTLGHPATKVSADRRSDPKRLSRLFRGELDWVAMKALEKDRNRRYETAGAIATDVQRYLSDEPVQACPPSWSYRLVKFARRNKVAVAMASLAAMALIALGAAGLLAYRNQLAEGRRRAEQAAYGQRLLAVQRQNALQRALMAAMSGDFEGAER